MEVKLIMKSARNAVIEIADGGIYNTKETYHVLLNGEEVFSTDTVINSLFDLKPQTSYEVSVRTADGTKLGTDFFLTLNITLRLLRAQKQEIRIQEMKKIKDISLLTQILSL